MTPSPNIPPIHISAFGVLVADGLVCRQTALDALLVSYVRQPQDASAQAAQSRGYRVTRELALKVDLGEIAYHEAEVAVACAISGGSYDDVAMAQAGQLLGLALKRLDKLREQLGEVLQTAIDGADLPSQIRPSICREARAAA